MGKSININYNVVFPGPFDGRLRVSTYAALFTIPVPYNGLITYVEDVNKDYRYLSGSWVLYTLGFASTVVGEPAGSSIVTNMVFITQADYDQAVIDDTLVEGTHYILTEIP
jgi:hypothetical protein